jgi:hypothetical protein
VQGPWREGGEHGGEGVLGVRDLPFGSVVFRFTFILKVLDRKLFNS